VGEYAVDEGVLLVISDNLAFVEEIGYANLSDGQLCLYIPNNECAVKAPRYAYFLIGVLFPPWVHVLNAVTDVVVVLL
jgi:hypothetical protein